MASNCLGTVDHPQELTTPAPIPTLGSEPFLTNLKCAQFCGVHVVSLSQAQLRASKQGSSVTEPGQASEREGSSHGEDVAAQLS